MWYPWRWVASVLHCIQCFLYFLCFFTVVQMPPCVILNFGFFQHLKSLKNLMSRKLSSKFTKQKVWAWLNAITYGLQRTLVWRVLALLLLDLFSFKSLLCDREAQSKAVECKLLLCSFIHLKYFFNLKCNIQKVKWHLIVIPDVKWILRNQRHKHNGQPSILQDWETGPYVSQCRQALSRPVFQVHHSTGTKLFEFFVMVNC